MDGNSYFVATPDRNETKRCYWSNSNGLCPVSPRRKSRWIGKSNCRACHLEPQLRPRPSEDRPFPSLNWLSTGCGSGYPPVAKVGLDLWIDNSHRMVLEAALYR